MSNVTLDIIIDAKDATSGAISSAKRGFSGLSGQLSQLADKASGVGSKLAGALNPVSTALKGLGVAGAAAGAGIAGIAVKGVQEFVGFEKQMAEVFTLLPGITQDAMADMSAQALATSKEFGILPEEIVPALYSALSAGVPADNVFDFLGTASEASIGGITSLETAVDGITSVVNAYGSEAISAGSASDIMFTAVRLGKTNFEELSSSLFNVIPTAASLGVGFEDVAAQMAVMTAQGVPTSVATTQLRAALVEASKGGTKLDEAFKKLTGQSFAQLIESGMTSTEAFEQLRGSMSDQEFKDLFGSVEALNAVLATTGPNFEATEGAFGEMVGSTGATSDAFDTMSGTTQFFIDKLKSLGSSLLIEVGQSLSPFLDVLAGFAPKLDEAAGKVSEFIDKISPTLESFAFALKMIQEGNYMDMFWHLGDAMGNLMEQFGQNDTLQAFQDFFFNIVGLMDDEGLTAFEAVKVAIVELIPPEVLEKMQEMRDKFDEIMVKIQEFIEPLVTFMAENTKLKDVLLALGLMIAAVVVPAIISFFAPIIAAMALFTALTALVTAVRVAWEEDIGGMRTKIENFRDGFIIVLGIVKERLTDLSAITAVLIAAMAAKYEELKLKWQVASAGIRVFIGLLKAKWQDFRDAFAAIVSAVNDKLNTFRRNFTEKINSAKQLVNDLIDRAGMLKDGIGDAFQAAADAARGGIDSLIGLINNLIDAINNIPAVNIPNLPGIPGSGGRGKSGFSAPLGGPSFVGAAQSSTTRTTNSQVVNNFNWNIKTNAAFDVGTNQRAAAAYFG